MLDKYKARKQKIGRAIEDFEATHDNVRKTHEHLSKHRGKYCLVTGVAIGVGATIVLRSRGINAPAISIPVTHEATNTIGDVTDSIVAIDQSLTIHQQFGGHCCKIIQDASDPSKMWPMIKTFCEQVAEENNTTPDKVRRMVERYWAGKADNVHGYYPQRYGVTTTG